MRPDTSQRRGKAVSRNQATKTALVSAAALVGSALFVSRILGFFRNSVIAALFGQNNITDAYNTAYLFPDTLYLILIGGANVTPITMIVVLYTSGPMDVAKKVLYENSVPISTPFRL